MADKINQIEIGGVTYDLQDKKSIFTGTAAEYEAVADTIEDGTVVNITDDLEDGTSIGVEITNKIESLENELEKTNTKVDTIIEKADLGIKEIISGEEIHLTDSAEGKAVEFALYGKARQNVTSGKNLLENIATSQTLNGVTFTVNNDGTVTANGTATDNINLGINTNVNLSSGSYILSGGISSEKPIYFFDGTNYYDSKGADVNFELQGTETNQRVVIPIGSGKVFNNETFYPMIRLASITDSTYEPYTNGATPRPDYPQEIEVSGESYNLLENTATSQTVNGVEFVVNEDKSITANGTASANAFFKIGDITFENNVDYVLSGCPNGGASSKYFLYANGYSASEYGNGLNIIYNEKTDTFIGICIVNGITVENLTFKPMIRKASVKNDRYMPYGVGSVEVTSKGKNLINPDNCGMGFLNAEDGTVSSSTYWLTTEYIKVKENEQLRFSKNSTSVRLIRFVEYDSEKNYIRGVVYNLAENITLNVGSDTKYIRLSFGINTNTPITKEDFFASYSVQLERGNISTEIKNYKETLSTIPTNGLVGIPVSSGGNYTDQNGQQWICDEVVKYADGSGKKIQRVGKLVLDGLTNAIQ